MARTTSTTTDPATSGIGWSHGIASQVSLPNISVPRPRMSPRARARTGRKLLGRDRIEQRRIDRSVSERAHRFALLRKRRVARAVECLPALARGGDPLRKRVPGYGTHHEIHVGEPAAAVLRGLAIKVAGLVGREM